jgi:gamma-glutamyltranspeptidase/glutathione hydrolase
VKRWIVGVVATLVLLIAIGAAAVAWGLSAWRDEDVAPEAATAWNEPLQAVTSTVAMVVAAHPLASQAGAELLAAGGTAADAAVATQAMLTLVEPQSSGIGGGAFLLFFDGDRGDLEAWDGRETAPSRVDTSLFLDPDGEPLGFFEAVVGGRSVGVPGVIRMLGEVHARHGRRPWRELFQPAIRAARQGFEVTPRLSYLLGRDPLFRAMPAASDLYYPGGRALSAGAEFRNPALADALQVIADGGPEAFYEGEIAESIVRSVQSAVQPAEWKMVLNTALLGLGLETWTRPARTAAPGQLSAGDLKTYRAVERAPVCADYRERWRVCGMPPPTSGGVTVLQILKLLEPFDLSAGPRAPEVVHLLAEASRLAFADRNRYLADPDFVDVPTSGLLDPDYLADRAQRIDPGQSMGAAEPGTPPGAPSARRTARSPERPSTSHFSVVDRVGNVVSMTTSVENVFGSRLVTRGFVLNNQLTDFAFVPTEGDRAVANRVQPGKRPRSSMAPVIVFDRASGEPLAAVGSPGGSRIIGYVAGALIGLLDGGLPADEAVRLPHVVNRNGATEVGARGWDPGDREAVVAALRAKGHEVRVTPMASGLHAVARPAPDAAWRGGADPRREGEPVSVSAPAADLEAAVQ